jgi:hypothetical protein
MAARGRHPGPDDGATPLPALLALTFLMSIGTSVFWNAIAFVAKHAYGFDQKDSLVLTAVMGIIYTVGAFGSGPILRRLPGSPRGQLALLAVIQAILCAGPAASGSVIALWAAAGGVSLTSSMIWPLVESYLAAGRHGADMRRAIGWFNFVWMAAVTVPLLSMPPILEHDARLVIGAQVVTNLAALVPLALLRARPGRHEEDAAARHVPPSYGHLLLSARMLLPTSYVLMSAMSPILPYRFDVLGTALWMQAPIVATWMIVRVASMLVMWRSPAWHGRWGTLLLGWAAMTGGFALVVLAPALPIMLAGFAGFGLGVGIVYYAALYYGLAVGRAAIDAGGAHEGLIGAGYAIGPFAALAATFAADATGADPAGVRGGAWIAAMTFAVAAVGSAAALVPYLRSRSRRAAAASTIGPP